MFSVIFEVHPRTEQWDSYLGIAATLRPDLEKVEGFVDNIRYRSLTREGWILSLSSWRDEKSVVRWRTQARHHGAQDRGRTEIFVDYHLRVGQVTKDTKIPEGFKLHEQRLDETEAGEATTVILINGRLDSDSLKNTNAEDIAKNLGLRSMPEGLVNWDVFDAVLTPGDVILLSSWRTQLQAEIFENSLSPRAGTRLRRVRIVRDYGMYDRREAPQYYPDVPPNVRL
jgi:heme-degrading monooxygenase HmoA